MSDSRLLVNALQPHRRVVLEYEFGEASSFNYLFGNTKPLRISTADFQINPIRCLFLGSGDLRNALHLLYTSSARSDWEFHLVDINPSIVARNLILLQFLTKEHYSVDDLWSIWYDFQLEKSLYDCLRKEIQVLAASDLDSVREQDRSTIRDTFHGWLKLFESNIDKTKACQQRHKHLAFCFEKIRGQSNFADAIEQACSCVDAALLDEDEETIRRARDEVVRYMTDGITSPTKNYDAVNITMLQPSTGMYTGHYDLHPYLGYFPFEDTEERAGFRQITAGNSCPLLVYSEQQMKLWIASYRQHRHAVHWHFWCGDALNIALIHMPLHEFDLIHTSNLCDHVDLLNLLVTCVHLLRHRSWSRILTQSMKWRSRHARFIDYLSQLFNNLEIGWLPSLLGVICESPRTSELAPTKEHFRIRNLTNSMILHEYQSWRLATGHEQQLHLRLDGTDVHTLDMLDRIAERCFYTHLTKPEADEGTGHSTALTYYLLLRQYAYRHCLHPEETFSYLFYRTCHRFQAYATGLRAIHAMLSNDDVRICSVTHRSCDATEFIMPNTIGTPVLQLAFIELDQTSALKLVRAMHTNKFQNQTSMSAVSKELSYDLRTGLITWSQGSQRQVRFHLMDTIVFQFWSNYIRSDTNILQGYVEISTRANIVFALPLSFQPSVVTTWLIDAHSWFPFRSLDFDETVGRLNISALHIRDTIHTCFVDPCDRKVHCMSKRHKSQVHVIQAFETSSSYQITLKITTQHTAWNYATKFTASKHSLLLTLKFSSIDTLTLRFAFACPLDGQQSTFHVNDEYATFRMMLAKDVVELTACVVLKTAQVERSFDLKTAKCWPVPQLADGTVLDPRFDLPSPMVIGPYNKSTSQVMDALSSMFTFAELHMTSHPTGDYLFRDPEFDLRESIRQMFLQAFAGRQRLAWYTTQQYSHPSPNDIRTFGDILLLFEGVFDYDHQPVLALSCLDMSDLEDSNIIFMTHWTRTFIQKQLEIQAISISRARKTGHRLPSDYNMHEILASTSELNLMRKLLKQNARITVSPHRSDLTGPWYASFVQPLRVHEHSQLQKTKLTEEQGINWMDVVKNRIQCQTCKKLPNVLHQLWPRCGRCKLVFYCSQTCQAKDWTTHKNICQSASRP